MSDAAAEYPWGHTFVWGDDLNSARAYRPLFRELSKRTLWVDGYALYPEALGFSVNTVYQGVDDDGGAIVTTAFDWGGAAVPSPINGRLVAIAHLVDTSIGHDDATTVFRVLRPDGGLASFDVDGIPNFTDGFAANAFPGPGLDAADAAAESLLGSCFTAESAGGEFLGYHFGSGAIKRWPLLSYRAAQDAVIHLAGRFVDAAQKDNRDPAFWRSYASPGNPLSTNPNRTPPPNCAPPAGESFATGSGQLPASGSNANLDQYDGTSNPNGVPLPLAALLPWWPGGCGFTRVREREITSLSASGQPGQRARFIATPTARYQDPAATDQTAAAFGLGELMAATPADQYVYGTYVMAYGPPSGSGAEPTGSGEAPARWHVAPDPWNPPDLLTFLGVAQAGDILGPWILNDLYVAIEQLKVLLYAPQFGTAGVDWWGGCYSCLDGTCRGAANFAESFTDDDGVTTSSTACRTTDPPGASYASPEGDDGTGKAGELQTSTTASAPAVFLLADMHADVTAYVWEVTQAGSTDADGSWSPSEPAPTGEMKVLSFSGTAQSYGCTDCDLQAAVLFGDVIAPVAPVSGDNARGSVTYGQPPGFDSGAYAYVDLTAGFAASNGGYGSGDPTQPCDPIDCSVVTGTPGTWCSGAPTTGASGGGATSGSGVITGSGAGGSGVTSGGGGTSGSGGGTTGSGTAGSGASGSGTSGTSGSGGGGGASGSGSGGGVASPCDGGLSVGDPSFEAPSLLTVPGGPVDYQASPTGTPWAFTGGGSGSAGITRGTGGAFGYAFPMPDPDGTQAAYIQNLGASISQTFAGFTVGASYHVLVYATVRAGYSPNVIAVSMGDTTIGTFSSTADWVESGYNFVATATSMSLAFTGTSDGDFTTILDAVQVCPGDAPVFASGSGTSGSGSSGEPGPYSGSYGSLIFAIACGSGSDITPFVADVDYDGGTTYSVSNTIDTSTVDSPAPMGVYQNERYFQDDGGAAALTYTIDVGSAGASVVVRLHFSENFATGPGQRLFDVTIADGDGAPETVLSAFDIYAAAGAQFTAVIESFEAVSDGSGNVTVAFVPGAANNPKIDGIEIHALA